MRRTLVLIALLLPLLAACGAEHVSDLDEAASALSKAGSSRVDLDISSGRRDMFKATGSFDYERDVGELKFTMIDDEFEPLVPVAVRLIGRTFYTAWSFGDDLRWLKEEGYELADAEALIVPFEGGPAPDKVLELLLKTSKRTQVLGSDEVRGVKAKHYRIHVDKDALLREAQVEKKALDDHDESALVVDAWIDDDNLVRRLSLPDDGDTVSFDFYDFGVEVDVDVPAPDELIPEGEFEKLLEAECKGHLKKPELDEDDFCALMAEVEPGGSTEYSTETVPSP
jgi:hypothetical protein